MFPGNAAYLQYAKEWLLLDLVLEEKQVLPYVQIFIVCTGCVLLVADLFSLFL